MSKHEALEYIVGLTAYTNGPDSIDCYCLTHSPRQEQELTQWGEAILKALRKKGIYINVTRSDPSGRW